MKNYTGQLILYRAPMAYVKRNKRNKYVFYCHIVVTCCINGLERQINKLEKKRMVVPGIEKKADFIRIMRRRSWAKQLDFKANMGCCVYRPKRGDSVIYHWDLKQIGI